MRDLVRKRMGAPLTIIISPWRSSKTKFDMRLFLFVHASKCLACSLAGEPAVGQLQEAGVSPASGTPAT
jgi:hypothetical protein